MRQSIDGFFDALGAATADPSDPGLRRDVVTAAQGLADNVISLDKLALDGSVRKASGSLEVTAKVGASPIHEKYTVNLMDTKAVLDVVKLAEKVADEVEKQAKIAGSAVQKAFKA